MSKLKARVEEILDGINDPATLAAVRKVQEILSEPADTEAIDRLIEKVSFLESVTQAQSARIVVLEKQEDRVKKALKATDEYFDAVHEKIIPLVEKVDMLSDESDAMYEVIDAISDTESPTAYVHRLETLINDIEAKFAAWVKTLEADADIERKRIDDAHHRLDEQLNRLIDLEHSVDRLGTTPPKPQRDTSWHPYDAKVDFPDRNYPFSFNRVVVMLRGNDEIAAPAQAGDWDWSECGDRTIIAWRCAKEGE